MKGGEEEREKAKGRKRRSEHRDRSVILLDSARSPVTFECSVDFTLAKGEEHRRKEGRRKRELPYPPSLFVLPPSPPPPIDPFPRAISPFLPPFLSFPSPIFLRSSTIQETLLRSISSLAVEKETEEEEGGKDRERERRIDRDSP